MANNTPRLTLPNTERIRAKADTTIADALQQTAQYVNRNVAPQNGNRRAAPAKGSRPIHPVPA